MMRLLTSIIIATLLLILWGCSAPTTATSDEDYCSKLRRVDSISLSEVLAPYRTQMDTQTGVFVLEEGGGSLITRAWLSEYAEQSIDIQYFIFSLDNVGLIACDYLVRAADRGVKVRILVDDIMVHAEPSDIKTLAAHENIDIKIYNPSINLGKNFFGKVKGILTNFRGVNQRMHNKTFIVDGSIAVTGGRNIADEYFDYDHEYNFRDRDVFLVGQAVGDISSSFEEYWNNPLAVSTDSIIGSLPAIKANSNAYDGLHQYACNPENFWPQIRTQIDHFTETIARIQASGRFEWLDGVRYVSDDPGKNDGSQGLAGGGRSTAALIELVQQAQHSIDIQTPYLITTDLSKQLFAEATKRGVTIRILTNSLKSTDNLEAFASYQKDRKKLLATGVEIYEFKPDAPVRKEVMAADLQVEMDYTPIFGLHAKSMVIDGHITVIGTFNLDPRSANLNTECITIIDSETVAAGVLSGMEAEFAEENAWRITPTFNPDSEVKVGKRIKSWTRKVLPKSIL